MSTPIDSPKPDKALWRYGVISPLLHRDANGLTQAQVLKMQAESRYIGPDGEAISLSPETIRKWLYRYRVAGLDGLADKPRSDSGRFDVPDAIHDAMVELRRAHPRWTLTRLLDAMMADGAWDGRSRADPRSIGSPNPTAFNGARPSQAPILSGLSNSTGSDSSGWPTSCTGPGSESARPGKRSGSTPS